MPNPAVPHHRLDTPAETERELSVAGEGAAEAPVSESRALSPAASGSTVLIPNVSEQPVVFGAVGLSESGSDKDRSEHQEENHAGKANPQVTRSRTQFELIRGCSFYRLVVFRRVCLAC